MTHRTEQQTEKQIEIEMAVCEALGLPQSALSLDGADEYAAVLNNAIGVSDADRHAFKTEVLKRLAAND